MSSLELMLMHTNRVNSHRADFTCLFIQVKSTADYSSRCVNVILQISSTCCRIFLKFFCFVDFQGFLRCIGGEIPYTSATGNPLYICSRKSPDLQQKMLPCVDSPVLVQGTLMSFGHHAIILL